MTAEPERPLLVAAAVCPCQASQTHCALCHRDLATILDDRLLGTVRIGRGIRERDAEMWGCAPTCETAIPRKGR